MKNAHSEEMNADQPELTLRNNNIWMENAPWLHVLMIHKVASLVTTLHL